MFVRRQPEPVELSWLSVRDSFCESIESAHLLVVMGMVVMGMVM